MGPDEAINGIVIRLPVVYGRNGSFVAMLIFNAAHQAAQKQDKFEALVGADTRWGTIHHDDAADLYLRVAERVSRMINKCRARFPCGLPHMCAQVEYAWIRLGL